MTCDAASLSWCQCQGQLDENTRDERDRSHVHESTRDRVSGVGEVMDTFIFSPAADHH